MCRLPIAVCALADPDPASVALASGHNPNAHTGTAPRGTTQHDDTGRRTSAHPAIDSAPATPRWTASPPGRLGRGKETKRKAPAAPGRPDNGVCRVDELRLDSRRIVRCVDAVPGTKSVADVDPDGVAGGDFPVDLRDDRSEPSGGFPAVQGRSRLRDPGIGAQDQHRAHSPDPRAYRGIAQTLHPTRIGT